MSQAPSIPSRPVSTDSDDSSSSAASIGDSKPKPKPTIPQRPVSMAPGSLPSIKPKPSIPQRPALPPKIEKRAQDFSLGDVGANIESGDTSRDTTSDDVSEKESKPSAPSASGDAGGESEPEPQVESVFEKRRKIVNEVLSTENYYVLCLEVMVRRYFDPLLELAETEVMPQRTKAEIHSIFSNIEQILPINKHLLEAVRQRVDNWHENQLLGDIFLKMAPFFKMYNTYGNNYEKAVETISRCQADSAFSEAVERIETKVKAEWKECVSLESLLIMPVQRIPRYNLLLRVRHYSLDNSCRSIIIIIIIIIDDWCSPLRSLGLHPIGSLASNR